MAVRTRINADYVRELAYWPLKLSLVQLGQRAGLADNYIYQLLDDKNRVNVSIDTLDALHNAIESRMIEIGQFPPDDLWERLTLQENV